MDYVFLVDLNSYISDDEIKPTDLCRCCLSNRNILALANDCCVYLLPLEKPNELIPVTLSNSPCLDLAWSNDGLFLLNVTKNGVCNLYNVKPNLLNSIDLVYTFQTNKNELACVKPFSKSSKLYLNPDKTDSLNYFEKYNYNTTFNCLKNIGNQPYNGFLLLTKTGMLHIFLTDFNSVKSKYQKYDFDMKLKDKHKNSSENIMDFDSERVESEENEIILFDLGDFTYETDGSLAVVYTNFDVSSPIYLYKVCLNLNNETTGLVEGTCELITIIKLIESIGLKSNILFTSYQKANSLCVLINQNVLQFWNRTVENTNWNIVHTFQSQSNITRLKISKSKDNFIDEKSFMLISYEDGTVGFFDYETFIQEFILPPIPSTTTKFKKNKEYIIAMDQSFSGSIGIGITNNSTLAVFRQFHFNAFNNSFQLLSIQKKLINFYEYCMLTGYDYWDLLINTNPKMIDKLIEILEKRYSNQPLQSIKKAYFSRFYSLIYSLNRRSTIKNVSEYKSLDILTKLTLNRSIIFLSNSVQLSLNIDSLISAASNSNMNVNNLNSSLINTTMQPPLINTSIISSNVDIFSNQSSTMASNINLLPFKTNLNEYFTDILNLDLDNPSEVLNINEIVQSILNRKNNIVTLNQQVKHIFQWIIDITLNIINEAYITISRSTDCYLYASSLLTDFWFLNELRKGLIFIKLIYAVNQSNTTSSSQLLSNSSLINSSLPILPFKSLVSNTYQQKDIICEMFNIITKLIHRINSVDSMNSEFLLEQCLSIQTDLIKKHTSYEKFFNLRNTWFGLSSSSWLKTFNFPVDYLFEAEKIREQYPLFDIIRQVDFSRSNLTKQCFRCGNYTESNNINTNTSNTISNNGISSNNSPSNTSSNNVTNNSFKVNSMQDLCGDKCICGGFWVLSSLLQ